MVFLCKGLSPEILDSALNRVVTEEALELDSPSDSVTNSNSAQKAIGNKGVDQLVTFILIVHGYSYVNGVELFVKQIEGVKRVKGDSKSIKLEVTGMVDPLKVRELVEKETKKNVELIFPSPQMEAKRVDNQISEEKVKKQTKKIQKNDIGSKKTEEGTYILKIKLCCDSCNQTLKKILKIKGLETVTMDVDKDLVKVKGTVDMTEVRSYIKGELKKDVVIIFPSEVGIPTEKDRRAAYKKEKDAGITGKKDSNDEATNKKDKGHNATFDEKTRAAITVYEKFEGTSMVYEKNEGIDAVDEKTKGIATVDMKVKDTTPTDAKSTGSATSDDKYKDRGRKKGKDYVFNDEKDKAGGRETKQHNRDKNGGAMRKENPQIYPNYDERKVNRKIYNEYDYFSPLKYSTGIDQMFSDENPNSYCSIM